ncbi:MAG: DegT/DnrJ/EryC1/StrS family aminotransferase [Selenomonadaceae bacterium]|nr:DegT/DnrJ/EryC1/StrS family aminotransferase [Selenomonadaceae bacterium]MBQ7493836.1 DegT/DnrJ/EryC1/StrS family aminotransferase [Selenomonadaceae bacterium]
MKNLEPFEKTIFVTRPVFPTIEEVTEKLRDIWQSKWLTNNGPQHTMLERELKNFLKVPHLSLFNNGTIALIVACQSLRLSGEVITTPFTFAATPHVLTWNNIAPIFCDVDAETMNIDAEKIESMITPRTTAILAVHVFGTPCDVEKIQEVADRYGLRVIYDAAHAFGVEIGGRGIGNFGDISMLSFHATKLYHTVEGGALVMKDEYVKQRIDLLKNFGIKNEEEVVMPGINGKLDEVRAAIGRIMLNYVEGERQKRFHLHEIYNEELADVEGVKLMPKCAADVKLNYQYYVIRIDEKIFGRSRDFVQGAFKNFNVYTRKYFHPLCSEYTCYRQLNSSSPANLPAANIIGQQVLSMPMYGDLTEDDVRKICAILKSFRR